MQAKRTTDNKKAEAQTAAGCQQRGGARLLAPRRGAQGAASGQKREVREGRKRWRPGLRRGTWRLLGSLAPAVTPQLQHLSSQSSPTGTWRSMAATNFVQEIHSMGERLLLKLQRLPQAEPVEIVAFSVLLLFTATVLVMLLIACSCCCTHCCCPEQRGRKVQVRPMSPA
uniref:Small integral membrane protein 5 n=1 Tax=Equus asinus TaxID=9793 RepID=A0A9L0K2Q0_EQUAS